MTEERARLELQPEEPWQRYLHAVQEREAETPEQERLLIVFTAWLNVYKQVELPTDPKALVREFLSNKERVKCPPLLYASCPVWTLEKGLRRARPRGKMHRLWVPHKYATGNVREPGNSRSGGRSRTSLFVRGIIPL
jgi:hypothetical protein